MTNLNSEIVRDRTFLSYGQWEVLLPSMYDCMNQGFSGNANQDKWKAWQKSALFMNGHVWQGISSWFSGPTQSKMLHIQEVWQVYTIRSTCPWRLKAFTADVTNVIASINAASKSYKRLQLWYSGTRRMPATCHYVERAIWWIWLVLLIVSHRWQFSIIWSIPCHCYISWINVANPTLSGEGYFS